MNNVEDRDEGGLERFWFESDVRRKLQIAGDLGSAIARQSPEVAAHEAEPYYRGYKKAIEIVTRLLLEG